MPDLRYEGWFGIFAPGRTADAIIDRIAQAMRAVMADAVLQAIYRSQGMEPDSDSGPDEFQRLVEATSARLGPVIKSIGLKSL